MPSVKVLLRTAKTLKNGEHPIVLRVIKERKAKFIFTGISCPEKWWDFKASRPSKKHPNKTEMDLFISNKTADIQSVILNLENDRKEYSSEHIKKKFKVVSKKTTVFTFLDEIITNLVKANKIGNSNFYRDTKRALKKYRNEEDMKFSDIDVAFLKKFERYFSEKGVSGNSISVYMRCLRSAFNKAISEGYCKRDIYPFEEYKISKLQTDTVKRALTREQMQKIIEHKLKPHSKMVLAKNMFLFSYYTRGMNFTDMATLKFENIKNDRLIYTRAKTGKVYNIMLLQPASEILKYYRMFTERERSDYVFPILHKEKHKTPLQIDYRIEKMNKEINRDLKDLATEAGIDFHLTTYVARHSYATILKRSGVSTSIISESLGHDSEKTTQIYLDSFENHALDEANRALL